MSIRIDRHYFRDTFIYRVELKYKSHACTIRQYCTDNVFEGYVSDDLKYVHIPVGLKIIGMDGQKPKTINRLKIPPKYLSQVRDNFE